MIRRTHSCVKSNRNRDVFGFHTCQSQSFKFFKPCLSKEIICSGKTEQNIPNSRRFQIYLCLYRFAVIFWNAIALHLKLSLSNNAPFGKSIPVVKFVLSVQDKRMNATKASTPLVDALLISMNCCGLFIWLTESGH